ncbi:MAG: recombinase [Burkholderiales bacterium]|nr:recombinase [Burkholderiales bacterium]
MTHSTTPDPTALLALARRLRGRDRTWTAGAAARFDAWLDGLERDDAERLAVAGRFAAIVAGTQHVGFFADLGIAPPDGFGAELRRRAMHRLLPEDLEDDQLKDWARRLFGAQAAASWALSIPGDRWQRLARLLDVASLPAPARQRLAAEMLEALKVLSARIAAAGVDPGISRVYPDAQRSASPFLEQQPAVRAYVDGWSAALVAGDAQPAEDDRPVRVMLHQCRDVVRRIRRNTGRTGVTVSLTFKLQRLSEIVDRLELLLDLLDFTQPGEQRDAAWMRFFRQQVRACADETSLRSVWRKSTELAALEITEHAGRTGEHYIAADRAQWWAMLRSAAVGGVVVAFMAIAKVLITAMHAPPLVEGVLVSLNYGLGFVLIQLLHGTVATKQPAMTAARIVAEVDAGQGGDRAWMPRVVELMVQVVRSQFVAVLGNVGVALPLAVLLTWALLAATGWSPASPEKSAALLDQLDPLGLTVFYAAIAGVCLFLAGIVSGYCDNLAVFHRLPRRVARMPLLVAVAGERRAQAVGAWVEHNFGALAGNFLFGCMLGGVSLLGTLSGLPLDIRHVAFASANLGMAGTVLWAQLTWQPIVLAAVGVVVIAVTNLAVSFTLSLMLALRARRLDARGIGATWRELVRRALSRPLDLVRPPPTAVRPETPVPD